MSMDASLRSAASLVRHRNVLTRAERLDRLRSAGKWDDNKSVYGLPKVGNRKLIVGGKPKKEETEGDAAPAAKGAKAAAGKAPAGKAPAGKAPGGKAPAGKAAAPAAKAAKK